MRAFTVYCDHKPPGVFFAESARQARSLGLAAMRSAGLEVRSEDVWVVRAPEHDGYCTLYLKGKLALERLKEQTERELNLLRANQ